MTPKEKALQLFDKYFVLVNYPTPNWKSVTKQCALIAVDEILFALNDIEYTSEVAVKIDYYKEVKQEIEAL